MSATSGEGEQAPPLDDVAHIRERYERERSRRLALPSQDSAAPIERDGRFARFGDDPFAAPPPPRPPRRGPVDAVVIGGGFGGLSVAIQLRKAGLHDVVVADIAADFGGNWYWNRYPGVRCDIESYLYLPYLEETGFVPSERYSPGTEILDYARGLARRHDLYAAALFQTRVTGLEWLEHERRWRVGTDRGDALDARFVVTQSGLFGRPQLPTIPGLTSFRGAAFHSSRWDYAATGGSPDGGAMDRLAALDVGVFGTGATGIQVIPHLARSARSVTVFQRTPMQVSARGNGPTDREWFAGLTPGWQQRRIRSFDELVMLTGTDECDVDDGWTRFSRHQLAALGALPAGQRTGAAAEAVLERSDFAWNARLRARVDRLVDDPAKAELLKAYYRTHCKRPGFSDDYLETIGRDNVSIVDLVAEPVVRVEDDVVVTASRRHRLDVLVFATGFDLGSSWAERAGYGTIGRDGLALSEKWKEDLVTYQGLFPHGFPNLFTMGPFHVASTPNLMRILGEQAAHIAFVVGHMRRNGLTTVEATPEAEREWMGQVRARSDVARRTFAACTPGYLNNQGRPESGGGGGLINRFAPALEYFDRIAAWRAAGRFDGVTFETG